MDHPSHFHHQHQHQHQNARYAPHPPRHSQFPEDPRLRPHHLPPPPPPPAPSLPPPPPPPALAYRNIRTPPPHPRLYNPSHQSHFPFNTPNYTHRPVEEERPVSANHPHDFSHSQRVSNRIIIDNDRPRHSLPDFDNCNSDNRVGVWNPPRVLSDNRQSRPYPPVDYDRELHHQHSLNHKIAAPYPPVDKLRYDSEGSSRLRVNHVDGYEVKTREELTWGRGDEKYHRRGEFGSNLDKSSVDFGIMSSQNTLSRDIHLYGVDRDNEISRGRRDGIGDSKRWVNDRKAPRDSHSSSFELGTNENGAGGDGIRITSGKYYGSELGRYNNRGIRESGHEFTRAPKKQIQKRSALLRLQMVKPNHRNRETEQLHYTSYADDSGSNSFRGKDQFEYSGYGMKTEEREGSPVELDISFKSNSLVAKAIVAPSSSAIVSDADVTSVSDTDLTSAEKKKNGLVSDYDFSDLKPAKPSTVTANLSSSPCKSNGVPCSGKDLQENVSDSQPYPSAIHNFHCKNEGAQTPKGIVPGDITKNCSRKTSPRVTKKKKIVKKVVKKVVSNPNLHVSSAISSSMLDKTVQADSVTFSPSFTSGSDKSETFLKEKITAVGKFSMPGCLQSSPSKVHLLPDNRKEDTPPLSMGTDTMLQVYKTDDNSEIGEIARVEKSENISSSPLGAGSIKDEKSDSDCLDADNFVHGLHSMKNTDKVAKSPNGSTFSDISNTDDVSKKLCQNEVSLSPGQYSDVQCLENRYRVEDDTNCRLSSSAESVINTDVINTSDTANVRVSGLSFTGNSQEKVAVCDIRNDGKADCERKAIALTDNAILGENQETSIPVPMCGMVDHFSSGETTIQDGQDCLKHSRVPMHGYGNWPTNSEDNITVPHGVIVRDSGKQASSLDFTMSPGNCATEQFPNAKFSERFGEEDTRNSKKRKVGTHLEFSSSNIGGIFPDPIQTVSIANVDTTFSPLKDPSPSEVSDAVVQSSEFSLHANKNGFTVLDEQGKITEAGVYFGNNGDNSADRASPMPKRNEVTTSHPNFSLCQAELCDAIVVATSCAEVPISISDNQTRQKEVAFSSITKCPTSPTLPYPEDSAKLYGNSLVGASIESMDTNRGTMTSECSETQHPGLEFNSLHEELASPNNQFPELEGEQNENGTAVVPINNTQEDIRVVGNTEREKIDIQAVEKCESIDIEQRSPSVVKSSDLQRKDDLPLEQDCLSCPADTDGVTISYSNALSDMFSPGTTSDIPDRRISDCPAIHNESIPVDEENVVSSFMVEHGSDLTDSTLPSEHTIENRKLDHATECNNLIMEKIMPQSLQVYSKVMTKGLNSSCSEGGKNQPGSAIPTTIQGRFVFPKSKTSALSTHGSKLRTWHRTGNNSASLPGSKPSAGFAPSKRPISEKKGNFQNTSYIRKGNNSIVRKHTPVSALPQGSVNRSSSLGFDDFHFRKSTGSESKVDITDQTNLLKSGITHTSPEGQRTPPPPTDTKLPNQTTTSSEENRSSSLIELLSNADCDSASEPRKFMESYDALNSAEDALKSYVPVETQMGPSNNGEIQVDANDVSVSSLNSKKIVYVKRKSNQLVASSNSCDLSVTADDTQAASSDGYYKRRKNQLVRTAFESHINQTVGMPIVAVNSEGKGTHKAVCNRRFSKKRSHKVVGTARKPLRASLVWTLCGANSSKNGSGAVHHQKVLPHLFPWKRATYLRNFIHNPALSSNASSLSAISKKLVLLRKRDTVYTRSSHGFSLRKSKVLGVGGSSLKWSKSIEKCSKKANEEATRAVAAVERKKREQKDVACISSRAKRQRIFRIGSVRYRMDPSGRTLHRISDDESPSSASIPSGLHAKRSYIPRRLVIGNDEYVRIGNGHQLIRDPKKRTRILANEKIRWSLHTARQRLARKQKYCQFFTRFGKCNKDDKKCPYIHDPSKVAVCTKFLNGLCSSPNCKLTHKVIPERMPDCSYFLQGLCTNRNCPYRHVNVNPKASVCEGFLRGYCADGNECPKKHSYVCPSFEATGICTQGTKCKLHHPQKQSKGKKRKRYGDQKNSRGRYFGSVPIDVSESGATVAPRQEEQNDDDLEGELADYISLDIDDEVAESIGQPSEQATFSDSEPLDTQMDDVDELIKPVLIMKMDSRVQESSV